MTPTELVTSTLKDNSGMCRAAHLIYRGARYGIPEGDLRTAAVNLGVAGVTEGGERYIALPEFAEWLEPWAKWCSDVVDHQRNQEDIGDGDGTPIPFDDALPALM